MAVARARISRRIRIVAALAVVGGTVALIAPAGAQYTPVTFGAPVLLTTFPQCGGYEPTVVVDGFNNVVVTAHKQNHCDAAAPDPNGDLPVRGASWLWTSSDGAHFTDMPGLAPDGVDRLDVGDEGDLATDDANHIYFVDTKVVDTAFTSWLATGNGSVAETNHTPAVASAEPSDDRPWVVAHGNGVVLYTGNNAEVNPIGTNGKGCGPGRFTVHMSTDGGQTFDHQGCALPGSQWCRPAADHTADSQYFYMICTDTSNSLVAYTSPDNGTTWNETTIETGGGANAGDQSWPSAAVGPDGTVYALYGHPNSLTMYRSTDHGATWEKRDLVGDGTLQAGKYSYQWMAVAPDGSIGLAYYASYDGGNTWYVYAGTAPDWTSPFTEVSVDPQNPVADQGFTPWGDFFTIAFGPDSRLHIVWTRNDVIGGDPTGATLGLNSNIFYAVEGG